jgi:hypothetical protein
VGKKSTKFRLLIAGTAIALMVGMAGVANAATQSFSFFGSINGKRQLVKLSSNGGATFSSAFQVGVYSGSLSTVPGSIEVFCVDVYHFLGTPFDTLVNLGKVTAAAEALQASGYYEDGAGNGGGLASAMTAADYNPTLPGPNAAFDTVAERVDAVSYLLHKYLNTAAFAAGDYAKAQLAIWDILQDGGDGMGAGSIQATDTSNVTIDISAVLADVAGKAGVSRPEWIQAPREGSPPKPGKHVQDFGWDPVPEPAFYQMSALLVLGGLGLWRRRSKK